MHNANEKKNIARNRQEKYTEEEMANRIPLLSDIVFKYIFGTEESADILKTFINAVLQDAGFSEIKSIAVVNPFNVKTYIDEKFSVIDTRAEDNNGDKYNIEVQVRTQADYQERSLYYWAKTYSDQLKDGELYGILKKVISISILNFCLFPDHVPYHSCYMLRENSNPENVLTEDCIMHYLEVPKLKGTPKKEIEKWLYFIEYGDKEDETVKVLIDNDAMFRAARRRYEYFIADEKARIAYQQRSMFLHDQANYIYTARKEGREEGREIGLEEGRQEGRQEGRVEEKKATARKMKELGISPSQISKVTGLEEKEIETL